MFDINELMNRANRMKEQAAKQMDDLMQSAEEAQAQIEAKEETARQTEQQAEQSSHSAETETENLQKQMEALTQRMGEEFAKQSAAMQEQISEEVKKQVGEMASLGSQELIEKLYGEDMAMLSAAFDTLEQLEGTDVSFEEEELSSEQLYGLIEEQMEKIQKIEEPSPVPYADRLEDWQRFGILLSGIISTVNDHKLDSLEVEEHIPVMDQQILSLVRSSWGITGREDLLEMLSYLTQGGYRARYKRYAVAQTAEELFDEETDDDEKEGLQRGWAFVQHFKEKYPADFLLGWDIGRAAMITRWGYFLGWITQEEAWELLSDMARTAAQGLSGWREFACSYLFGGAFWKEVCAAYDASYYLDTLAHAVEKLMGSAENPDGGQWKKYPWPRVFPVRYQSH